ncbi:MAG: diaminopimelate decarboxylase [Pseudomonadota bacterium]
MSKGGPFSRNNNRLHMDGCDLSVIAETYGTPTYVYSRNDIVHRYERLDAALGSLDHALHYAVKANSNLSILRLFADLGAGFDIVSAGELERVLIAGGDPKSVLFSGVGKRREEIAFALKVGIGCFNVESGAELDRLADQAALLQRPAPVSIRVNPNVDAATHPYISTGLKDNKFGVPQEQALALYERARDHAYLDVIGIDCHIGSQIAESGPLLDALQNLLALVDRLAEVGIELSHLDLGGGLGVRYHNETEFDVESYGAALRRALTGRKLKLLLEPGRFLVATGGVLLTRLQYLKPSDTLDGKSFAVVDAAMNDLIRPALYQAHHDIEIVAATAAGAEEQAPRRWDIVGPVCESGDFLAQNRTLALHGGELLAVHGAGAYGMVQASNYNSRGRAAEVLVEGDSHRRIRRRETLRDQIEHEIDDLERPVDSPADAPTHTASIASAATAQERRA